MFVGLLRRVALGVGVAIALGLSACGGGGSGGGDAGPVQTLGSLTLAVRDAPSPKFSEVKITITEAGVVYGDGEEQTFSFEGLPFDLKRFVIYSKLIAQLKLQREKDQIQSLRLTLGPVDATLLQPGPDGTTKKVSLHRDKLVINVPLTFAQNGKSDAIALIDIPIESWIPKDENDDGEPDGLEHDETLVKGIDWLADVLPIKDLTGKIDWIDPIAGIASVLTDVPGADGWGMPTLVDLGSGKVLDQATGSVASWWASLKAGDTINIKGPFQPAVTQKAANSSTNSSGSTQPGGGFLDDLQTAVLAVGQGIISKAPSPDVLTQNRVLAFRTTAGPDADGGWIVAEVLDNPLAAGLGPFANVVGDCMALDLSRIEDTALQTALSEVGAEFIGMVSTTDATTTLDCDGTTTTTNIRRVLQAVSLETQLHGLVTEVDPQVPPSWIVLRVCQVGDSPNICDALASALDTLNLSGTTSGPAGWVDAAIPSIVVEVQESWGLTVAVGDPVTVTGYFKSRQEPGVSFRATKVEPDTSSTNNQGN